MSINNFLKTKEAKKLKRKYWKWYYDTKWGGPCYHMEKSPKQELKEQLYLHRGIKEESREDGINLGGRKGNALEEILDTVHQEVEQLLSSNASWVQEKIASVREYLKEFSVEEIKVVFFQWLDSSVTQYFRLLRKNDPFSDTLNDHIFREELIRAFFVDFVLALRSHKGGDITPQMALELARLSYRHNPNSLILLQEQYPDVDPGVIKYAAIHYPSNPSSFIEQVIKKDKNGGDTTNAVDNKWR